MFHALRSSVSVARLAAVAVILALACPTVHAQVKPFKVTGNGVAPKGFSAVGADSEYSATGNATHLGKYSGDGFAKVVGDGQFVGAFTFVAANGDKLAFTHGNTDNGAAEVGTFEIVPIDLDMGIVIIVFVAEFNPVPELCTGRFKNVVDGSFIMTAITEPFVFTLDIEGFTPPFDFTWSGEGWIKFAKP